MRVHAAKMVFRFVAKHRGFAEKLKRSTVALTVAQVERISDLRLKEGITKWYYENVMSYWLLAFVQLKTHYNAKCRERAKIRGVPDAIGLVCGSIDWGMLGEISKEGSGLCTCYNEVCGESI